MVVAGRSLVVAGRSLVVVGRLLRAAGWLLHVACVLACYVLLAGSADRWLVADRPVAGSRKWNFFRAARLRQREKSNDYTTSVASPNSEELRRIRTEKS